MELRQFLRVTHFAFVEKGGTVWVARPRFGHSKSKNASTMLAVDGKNHNIT